MTLVIRLPGLRSLALIGSVVIAGALLVGPVMAGAQPAAPLDAEAIQATTYTRTSSCSGLNFHPIDSDTGYSHSASLLSVNPGICPQLRVGPTRLVDR